MGDHPVFAALYDGLTAPLEAAGLATRRRRLLASATGRVLEVGGGTGANLRHYAGIESLTVVEPDGAMRRRLQARLPVAGLAVTVLAAGIEDAGLPDASFDTVVCTLVLCTVPEVGAALATVRRLLAPGGRLLYLEHVRSPGWRGRLPHAATPLWKRLVPGCHLDRDPIGAMRAAGFAVTDCDRFALPLLGLPGTALAGTAVQGEARPADRRAA